MIVAGSASPLLLSSAGGYNLTKSLRFRRSASAYLNRTFSSPTNNKLFTWSGWVKRSEIGVWNDLFGVGGSNGFGFNTAWNDNGLAFFTNNISGDYFYLVTTQVFRDPSAWYHIVLSVDTTQATASNRAKIYVNGVQITAFNSAVYQSQNSSLTYNSATTHYLCSLDGSIRYFDGYLAEVNFIDGQALTPSSFGETSTTTGVWIPKKYTGTYGTNGFYLPFTDTTSTSTLGTDFSGNSNTWTVNNISLTSGSTYDSMLDVPTLTSATTANYCVLNPLPKPTNTLVFSNGNLNLTVGTPPSSTNNGAASGTMSISSGKWYWEITAGDNFNGGSANYTSIGIGNLSTINSTGEPHTAGAYMYYANGNNANGFYWDGSSFTSYGAAYKQGNIIGVALDLDTNQITWYVNNSSQGVKTITAGSYVPRIGGAIDVGNIVANFGQRPFSYTPPTGFVALNTFNLPTPTIGATASTTANKYMDATLYTGNGTVLGSTQTITNAGSFQPDFVWLKSRSNAEQHNLYDVVRGISSGGSPTLFTDATTQETTYSGYGVSALNSNGFTVIGNGGLSNNNGFTYVGFQWKANGAGVTNTDGNINSSVSANTTSGFSIVTYTGNATTGSTVGHGLGTTPTLFIIKSRGTQVWNVYSLAGGITGNTILQLDSTDPAVTGSNISLTASSTTIGFGSAAQVNGSTVNFVAYCFAPVAGYSAFGSYTGNGNPNGPFIYTGFRPRFIILKRYDAGADAWIMMDTSTQTYNVVGNFLQPSQPDQELTTPICDFLSNGFKLRETYTTINTSNGTYIYMAFAESPFKYANAR